VVYVTRDGVSCYLLRIREGASKSLVGAVMKTLAANACRGGQRVMGDVKVTEIEFVVGRVALAA
jgi:hypothetical protein